MILAITALLAVITFGFVGYPLLRPHPAELAVDPVADEMEKLTSKRDNTLAAIKELEFDYEAGNLSAEDFKDMEERYRERAIAILKDIDQVRTDETTEDAIERQIREMRQARRTGTASVEAPPDGSAATAFCFNCGAPLKEGARFCAQCGASLVEQRCAQCGTPLAPDDRFCAKCGTPASGGS